MCALCWQDHKTVTYLTRVQHDPAPYISKHCSNMALLMLCQAGMNLVLQLITLTLGHRGSHQVWHPSYLTGWNRWYRESILSLGRHCRKNRHFDVAGDTDNLTLQEEQVRTKSNRGTLTKVPISREQLKSALCHEPDEQHFAITQIALSARTPVVSQPQYPEMKPEMPHQQV